MVACKCKEVDGFMIVSEVELADLGPLVTMVLFNYFLLDFFNLCQLSS